MSIMLININVNKNRPNLLSLGYNLKQNRFFLSFKRTIHIVCIGLLPCIRFRIPLSAGFSDKYYVSPRHCFDVVSLGKALNPQMLNLTQVKISTW